MLPTTLEKPKVRVSAPDELYSAGYRDATRKRCKNPQFYCNAQYLAGYRAGYEERPDALINIPRSQESYLERGHGDELLNAI